MKIKTTNLFISILLCLMFSAAQTIAQNIIFITPVDNNREAENIAFLERQGFNVTPFWPGSDITLAGQDTIDMLNAADLVIIGRSGPSTSFQEEKDVWNAITAPVLLICPWKARSSRLKWFNSASSYHENYAPEVAYAKIADPTDQIFTNANVAADSTMDWFSPPPHDFIRTYPATTTTNAEIVATYNDSSILIARFAPNVRFYDETADSAAGPRTYMGLGNDDLGWPNFFPFTKNAKAVYLAEICTMMGIPIQEPVFGPSDNEIIFITPVDNNRETENIAFLERQGFKVKPFWPGSDITLVGQDTIDMLNDADLVIIGRGGPSTSFQEEKDVWNGLTSPLMLICQWKARSSRLKWFNSTSSYHENYAPEVVYAKIADPTDIIFADADVAADSTMDWFSPPPHDFIRIYPTTTTTNAEIVATYNDSSILIARFAPNVRFYDETPDSAAGPRTYMGMGNDDLGWPNFFPFTKNAKKVYLAEICRMLDIDAPEIVWGPPDMNITFIAPLEPSRELPNMNFLKTNGFKVKHFWPGDDITLAGQDTIDMLNAADLVIIGRSGPSTSFQEEKDVWNGLTAPLMLICQWKARSSRLHWFNSTSAYHENTAPEVAVAKAELPDDIIFSNVTLTDDSMEWCLAPHDYIRISPATVTTNAEVVATYNDSSMLVARFAPNVRFYDETADSAAGPRTYFGMGNDDFGFPNFFPLTAGAQQVYLNEICNILGIGLEDAVTLSSDATLSDIQYDVSATLDPAFDPAVTSYTLALTDSNVVDITAVPSDENATVVGDSIIDVTSLDTVLVILKVTAENGNYKTYRVTIEPYVVTPGFEDVAGSHINMFPNPVSDLLNITSVNPKVRITVYNTIGKVVMEHNADNNLIQLDVSKLDAGIYLIRMEDSENVLVGKFCKE